MMLFALGLFCDGNVHSLNIADGNGVPGLDLVEIGGVLYFHDYVSAINKLQLDQLVGLVHGEYFGGNDGLCHAYAVRL